MSPDVWFLLVLAIKMAVAAAFVVTASFIAERAGALVGAMVVTLPIAAGPAYILLALDHGAAFIADSTVASLAVHAASGIFGMAYVFAAQRRSFAVTIAAAVGTWIACALAIRAITWSVPGAILVNVAAYGVCVPLAQRYLHVRMPVITRRWFDIPLRACLVAVLVGAVARRQRRPGARRHVRGFPDRDAEHHADPASAHRRRRRSSPIPCGASSGSRSLS